MAILPAATPADILNYYVNFTINSANEYKQEALSYADAAAREARTSLYAVSELQRDGELNNVNFIGINDNQFNIDTITDLRNEFDSKYHYLFDILIRTVPNEFNKFINDYFPKPSNFDEIEKFLIKSVFDGSIGFPSDIERQIWERSRQKIELSNHKQIMENRRSMAARGFSEPNGVELYREMIIRNEGNKNISADSSAIAIESAKLRIDWIKFAVSEVRNYRTLALESAFRYLANILSIQDQAFRYASGYVDSYKTFYDAVNTYYNSVNTINRLNLEKANMIDNRNLSYDKFFVEQVQQQDEQRIRVYTSLVQGMAQQASAALSSLNSIVTIGKTTLENAAATTS